MSDRERERSTVSRVWGIASSQVRRHERVQALREQWSPECKECGFYSGVFFTYLVGHLQLWDFPVRSAWHLWLQWLTQWWFTSVHCQSRPPPELQLPLDLSTWVSHKHTKFFIPQTMLYPSLGLPYLTHAAKYVSSSIPKNRPEAEVPSWTLSPAQFSNLPNSINSL